MPIIVLDPQFIIDAISAIMYAKHFFKFCAQTIRSPGIMSPSATFENSGIVYLWKNIEREIHDSVLF